jgi:hypothetical protein
MLGRMTFDDYLTIIREGIIDALVRMAGSAFVLSGLHFQSCTTDKFFSSISLNYEEPAIEGSRGQHGTAFGLGPHLCNVMALVLEERTISHQSVLQGRGALRGPSLRPLRSGGQRQEPRCLRRCSSALGDPPGLGQVSPPL